MITLIVNPTVVTLSTSPDPFFPGKYITIATDEKGKVRAKFKYPIFLGPNGPGPLVVMRHRGTSRNYELKIKDTDLNQHFETLLNQVNLTTRQRK